MIKLKLKGKYHEYREFETTFKKVQPWNKSLEAENFLQLYVNREDYIVTIQIKFSV